MSEKNCKMCFHFDDITTNVNMEHCHGSLMGHQIHAEMIQF